MAAGLEPMDVWTETRRRRVSPADYGARMEAVGSHLWADLPPVTRERPWTRMHALFRAGAADGGTYRYSFVKTFAIARRGA